MSCNRRPAGRRGRPLRQPVLQVDGLLEHGELWPRRPLPVVLVGLQLQAVSSGSTSVARPYGPQIQPGSAAVAQQQRTTVADPLCRDDADPRASRPSPAPRRGDGEPSWRRTSRPQHPQRVVAERLLAWPCVQHPGRQAGKPPYGSTSQPVDVDRHGVDVKSPRNQIPSRVSPNTTAVCGCGRDRRRPGGVPPRPSSLPLRRAPAA